MQYTLIQSSSRFMEQHVDNNALIGAIGQEDLNEHRAVIPDEYRE
jgi:hypothetical protein